MLKNKSINIYDFVIVLLVIGIYLGYTSMLLVVALMLLRLLSCNRREIAVVMLFLGMPCFGFIFQTFHIAIPGSLIALIIGVSLSLKDVVSHCLKHMQSVWLLFVLFLLFTLFYFIGPRSEYATTKLLEIYQTGIATFFSFILLNNYKRLNMKTISQFYLLYSLMMLAGALNYWKFPSPSSLFDFGFIRETAMNYQKSDISNLVNYQDIGIAVLIGLAFRLSVEKMFNLSLVLFVILVFWITLMSGARQAIFGVPIVILFWALIRERKFRLKSIILPTVIALLLLLALKFVNVPFIQTSLNSSLDFENRIGGRDYLRAIILFLQNPVLGTGLGGYYNPALLTMKYPHNLILELLCETGLVGLVLSFSLIIVYLYKRKFNIYHALPNKALFFVIWIAFFLRAMISLDLGSNIVVFTSILAISQYSILPQNKQIKSLQKKNDAKP